MEAVQRKGETLDLFPERSLGYCAVEIYPEKVAVKRLWRLFTKNTGLCKLVRGSIGTDACPMPEG